MSEQPKPDLLEVEIVLGQLHANRRQFSERSREVEATLISWLIAMGEYRLPIGSPHSSIARAVEGYGAWWHRWDPACDGVLACPSCSMDFRDHENGPPFLLKLAAYDLERDRTSHWQCPRCLHEWARR